MNACVIDPRLIYGLLCVAAYVYAGDLICLYERFARTPKMSTYLLAIVIGEFDSASTTNSRGVQTTVYTPLGQVFAIDSFV